MTSPVTHYADAEADPEGIAIIDWDGDDGAVIEPVPSLCRQGQTHDLMTWFWDGVTCPLCIARAEAIT